jgi:hypothetical protein
LHALPAKVRKALQEHLQHEEDKMVVCPLNVDDDSISTSRLSKEDNAWINRYMD